MAAIKECIRKLNASFCVGIPFKENSAKEEMDYFNL
jgi:hypothetical protein